MRRVVEALRRLNIGIQALQSRLARKLGVSTIELNALTYVAEGSDITPKQLALDLNLTTGAMTAMIDRMEAAGFVVRRPNPTDRRSVLLQLTPAGDHAIRWAYEHFDNAVAAVLGETPTVAAPGIAAFLDNTAKTLAQTTTDD